MCGFVAVMERSPVNPERLDRQTDALAHRGPDDRGIWIASNASVGLGSRRLSIIDLSTRGHMPMVSAGGQVAIAFNGEIYNFQSLRNELLASGYQFTSETDTEVVLAGYLRWGREVVDRLDGMFGFAIYDGREAIDGLFIARDRAGEKPVLIYQKQNHIIVASELSAILADERVARNIDPASLNALLALGYVPGESSLIRGVRKLRPAHWAWIQADGVRFQVERYWRPPLAVEGQMDIEQTADSAFTVLKKSVARQLVADVPVGIFLSGGLDSSLVTAAAAAVSSQRIKTFTIAFPGAGGFDESAHALQVARYFGTEHHVLDFTGELFDEFQFVANNIDEPIGDASILPTSLLSRFARTQVTVALGGDGGDELFGGYSTYVMLDSYRRQRARLPGVLRTMIAGAASRLPLGTPGRARLGALRGDVAAGFVERGVVFNRYDRQRLFSAAVQMALRGVAPEQWRRELWPLTEDSDEQAAMHVDFLSYLPDDILTKVDRASMLHSLEVRAPFLVRELIEFAFRNVPTEQKVVHGRTKILLKHIALRVLPRELNIERKQGFSIPTALFRSSRWNDYARESITMLSGSWFDRHALLKLRDRVCSDSAAAGFSFLLVLLAHWQRRWSIV